jgi:hypothetical protein
MNKRLLEAAAAVCLFSPASFAFDTPEHEFFGREGYQRACEATKRAHPSPTDLQQRRLQALCEESRAALYGQSVAIAGDFIENFDDFFTRKGIASTANVLGFLTLANVNSAHFHPQSVHEWRRLHAQAIDLAVNASLYDGAHQADYLEHVDRAWYANAFGDHFLQDSFAAGHMGFNRPASSASASKTYHDRWNRLGRCMRDLSGAAWLGFGDGVFEDQLPKQEHTHHKRHEWFKGQLDDEHWARHVIGAQEASAKALLEAIVFGQDTASESVEALFPVSMSEADSASRDCLKLEDYAPTNSMMKPTMRSLTSTVGWLGIYDKHFRRRLNAFYLAAVSEIPVNITFFNSRQPIMIEYGLGGGLVGTENTAAMISHAGLIVPGAFPMFDGALSHLFALETTFRVAPLPWKEAVADDYTFGFNATYRPSIELGPVLIQPSLGYGTFHDGHHFIFGPVFGVEVAHIYTTTTAGPY